jgi:hypothetical protein
MSNEETEMNLFILTLPFRGNLVKQRDLPEAVETTSIN